MTWIAIAALALAAFLLLVRLLRAPRAGWEALAAALLFGLAGYALHGRPSLPSAPKTAQTAVLGDPAAMVRDRQAIAGGPNLGNRWMVIGDALARNGQHSEAAGVLLGAVDSNPKDADAWTALGNALLSHAEGALSPAALYAFRRGEQAQPDAPGPRYFLGMALAQNGRFAEARAVWAGLLAQAPATAPWRSVVAERIARLDQLIAAQQAQTAP